MMRRPSRTAAEIVSGIGSLGFDLQHYGSSDIAEAVAFLRTVNPQMFDWLAQVLTPHTVQPCLALEYGFKAHERGWNWERTIEEFRKLSA